MALWSAHFLAIGGCICSFAPFWQFTTLVTLFPVITINLVHFWGAAPCSTLLHTGPYYSKFEILEHYIHVSKIKPNSEWSLIGKYRSMSHWALIWIWSHNFAVLARKWLHEVGWKKFRIQQYTVLCRLTPCVFSLLSLSSFFGGQLFLCSLLEGRVWRMGPFCPIADLRVFSV